MTPPTFWKRGRLVSAGALALLAKAEGRSGPQPINATIHWLRGEKAGFVERTDVAHTALGYVTHHASSVLWAILFERLRSSDTATDIASIARDAGMKRPERDKDTSPRKPPAH